VEGEWRANGAQMEPRISHGLLRMFTDVYQRASNDDVL